MVLWKFRADILDGGEWTFLNSAEIYEFSLNNSSQKSENERLKGVFKNKR